MKAFLLAAGFGTRLRPLTNNTPKCLLPINGRPLLDYWVKLFTQYNVSEVLLNTHYLYEQVRTYIRLTNKTNDRIKIIEAYEPALLGSGGTVSRNRSFITDDEPFYICYADNLTNIDLGSMLDFHRKKAASFTMALFRSDNPSQCGIVELDETERVIDYIEKPSSPKSNLANTGVYLADRSLFELFPTEDFIDFGKDVLPKLTGQMFGWETNDYLLDIGTPKNYQQAQEDAKLFI